jgi:uncharacterized protein (DUF1499 family)
MLSAATVCHYFQESVMGLFNQFLFGAATLVLTGCHTLPTLRASEHVTSLTPCSSSPNCVSSNAVDSHRIEVLVPKTSIDATWTGLIDYLESLDNVTIVDRRTTYIHAESRTRIMRFVDDIEFLLVRDKNEIAVRSASRLGYSDFGQNRRRVEGYRAALVASGLVIEPN